MKARSRRRGNPRSLTALNVRSFRGTARCQRWHIPSRTSSGVPRTTRRSDGQRAGEVLESVRRWRGPRPRAARDLRDHGQRARRLRRQLPSGRRRRARDRAAPRAIGAGDGIGARGRQPARRLARLRGAGRRRRGVHRGDDLAPLRARGPEGTHVRHGLASRAGARRRRPHGVRRQAGAGLHLGPGALGRWPHVGRLVGVHALGLRGRLRNRVLREEAVAMIFPFESLSDERRALGLGVAVVVGIAFGFVQERSGFGRAQKLVGQFYGYDMTVLKVMFTAIVTAMLGTVVLSGLGLLDLHAVEFNYPTYLWPMIVGGLILGVGFILSGYCPGTSFVAATSGKLGGFFLYQWLHVPRPLLAVLIAILAVVAFAAASRIERRARDRSSHLRH